jgi:hypothetical protein
MYKTNNGPIFETSYIDAVEVRVRAVRAASRAWLETLKLSNNALCNLSTSITDLNNIMEQVKAHNFDSYYGGDNTGSDMHEDNMMHHTNVALVDLSNRLTGLIGKHFQSKGVGNQDSLFGGMDELLKRISFINRKSLKKINAERDRKEYYRRKVRRMRQKFILKRSLLPSSPGSSIFPIVTQKQYEKKIARNEIKLKYAMRRYDTVSERNAQDIAATLALCGDFFQPCFKQMILWLVTYYRSVAGAFDELGACLDNDNDINNSSNNSNHANQPTSSSQKTTTATGKATSVATATVTTKPATVNILKHPKSAPSVTLPPKTLATKSKSDGELIVTKDCDDDAEEEEERRSRLKNAGNDGSRNIGVESNGGNDSKIKIHKRSPAVIYHGRAIEKVHSKSDGDVADNNNNNLNNLTSSGDSGSDTNVGNRPPTHSESTTITSGSDGDTRYPVQTRQRSQSNDQNESKGTSMIIKPDVAKRSNTANNPFLSVDYVPPTLGDAKIYTHKHSNNGIHANISPKGRHGNQQQPSSNDSKISQSPSSQDANMEEPLGGDRPYTILGELGKGAFGTTTLVMDERNNELCVLKRIICESVEQANEALDEARLMSNLRAKSKHVVEVRDFFLDIRDNNVLSVCLVMEYVPGGDLAAKLKANMQPYFLNEAKIINLTKQLLTGLIVIHNNGLVHRDLKPANLLLSDEAVEDTGGVNLIKICDFGVATALSHSANTIVGTPHYMAPEIVEGDYGNMADVWSLGCILYEMCALKRPDFAMTSLVDVLNEVRSRGYSTTITALLERMLQRDPSKRGSATSLLNFLTEEDGDDGGGGFE